MKISYASTFAAVGCAALFTTGCGSAAEEAQVDDVESAESVANLLPGNLIATCGELTTGAEFNVPGSAKIILTNLQKPTFNATTQTLSFDLEGGFVVTSPNYDGYPNGVNIDASKGVARGTISLQGTQVTALTLADLHGEGVEVSSESGPSSYDVSVGPKNSKSDYDTLGCQTNALISPPLFTPHTAIPAQGAIIPVKQFIAGSTNHGVNGNCSDYPGCLKSLRFGDALAYSVDVAEAKQYSFDLLVKNPGGTTKQLVINVNGHDKRTVVLPNQTNFSYRFPTTSIGLEKGSNLVTISVEDPAFTANNVATIAQLVIH